MDEGDLETRLKPLQMEIYLKIPKWPEEIRRKELAKKLGITGETLVNRLSGFPGWVNIAESENGRLSRVSVEDIRDEVEKEALRLRKRKGL